MGYSKDKELADLLMDKLRWYTFDATDAEWDDKQMLLILNLLDMIDPMPDATIDGDDINDVHAALRRLQKRYGISDKDLLGKTRKESKHE